MNFIAASKASRRALKCVKHDVAFVTKGSLGHVTESPANLSVKVCAECVDEARRAMYIATKWRKGTGIKYSPRKVHVTMPSMRIYR